MAVAGAHQGSAPPNRIAQFRSDGFTAATGLRVPFFSDGFSRAYGLPETRLVNMISEAVPLREERPYVPLIGLRKVRYSRPGLASAFNYRSGPIRGLFLLPQSLGGNILMVSGNTAYDSGGANLGTIGGSYIARGAISPSQMVIVAGASAYPLGAIASGGAAIINDLR